MEGLYSYNAIYLFHIGKLTTAFIKHTEPYTRYKHYIDSDNGPKPIQKCVKKNRKKYENMKNSVKPNGASLSFQNECVLLSIQGSDGNIRFNGHER